MLLQPASKTNVLSIIEKFRGEAPVKGPSKSAAKSAPSKPAESTAPATSTVSKKKTTAPGKAVQAKVNSC